MPTTVMQEHVRVEVPVPTSGLCELLRSIQDKTLRRRPASVM